MGNLVYDFMDNVNGLLLALFFCLALAGVGAIIYALFFMPNKECEFDGKPMKLKKVPLGFRFLFQGFPLVLGIVLALSGLLNLYDMGKFLWNWNRGEVLEVSGVMTNVSITEDAHQDEALSDVAFTVDGEEFTFALDQEQTAWFAEGGEVTVQYGYAGDELLLYRVYVE